ncbi:RuvC family protein [Prevotella amnii]|uniref:Uncharacterized protein n=1 Tax=Prevotella amnii DNF00058 TaxID=1401066 RepID=A0A096D4E9_9BACT|nr:hypothetical protein [Prevotella amnii]KGF52384.1 hypothetical protein HMPREF9302_03580 [Prevotella amnii DNF00058]
MSKVYIGVDNGVTGTIGIVGDKTSPLFVKTPVIKEQNYTKARQMVTRVDSIAFEKLLGLYLEENVLVIMERPLVNPTRFKATTSALRCFEAELIIIELLKYPHIYIDSKEWQRVMLPKGLKGSDEQKKASLDIGNRLFPVFKDVKHKDRDGLLIAEYARRKRI